VSIGDIWRARRKSRLSLAIRWTLVAAAYFGSAKLGFAFANENSSVTAIWPPTGIALAAVLLGGYRMLPAVAVGAFLAYVTTPAPLGAVIGISVGNTLEALVGGLLLRRAGFDQSLERMRDVLALVALAGGLSTVVSATIGVLSLYAAGSLAAVRLPVAWRVWWLGDMGGDLLVATAVLVFARGLRVGAQLSAVRLRQLLPAVGGIAASGVTVWFTVRGHGPFAGGSPDADLTRAQIFVSGGAITALLVAAARSERLVAETALASLADSQRALAEAQRLTSIGSFELDVPSGHTTWSDELYRILGLDSATYAASFESWRERIHEEDRAMVDAAVGAACAERSRYSFVHRIIRPDGAVRTVECRGRIEVDAAGKPLKMVGTAQDITALKLSEERFRRLLENAPDAMVIVDEGGSIVLVNSQTERLFGYERHQLIGRAVEMLVPARFRVAHRRNRAHFADAPHARPMGVGADLYARRWDGTEFPAEISLSPLQTERGKLYVAAVRDVTERRLAADALAHQATHDPLTGLPNRALFLDRLEHALAAAQRSQTKLAVLFLDFDDFKLVNDSLGHDTGDLLLVGLTPRLTEALRPGDTVGRFGGDEFVVLCPDLTDEADAIAIAERIADHCGRPVSIRERDLQLTVSIGVAMVQDGDATPTVMLRDADAAMYRAKALGKGRVEVFDEGMRAPLIKRIAVESEPVPPAVAVS
jgi:diguanylate cyclase (GGDEF)-like protein/PAS domain S-box-containing protein